MITAVIFFIHLLFALLVFTKKWQEENMSSALLNLGLVGILFAVGWSISGMFAKAVMEPPGFGIYFDRDTFSLAILLVAEFFFYRMYYKDLFIADGKGIQ
jgi:formate hydrogenlyase subunit 3/multisubunit Na+/H+ antiporter MnhD subunit